MLKVVPNGFFSVPNLLIMVIITIAFHAFPVIRIGGCFKLFELFAFIILLSYGVKLPDNSITHLLFTLFVVSPIISLVVAYLFYPYPEHFFLKYPKDSVDFKYNYYVYPILQTFFMVATYSCLSLLYCEHSIYKHIAKILRMVAVIGFWISVYSIFAAIVYNPIRQLPNFVQNLSDYSGQYRSQGLYQEPSMYIIYQSWIVFITYYLKKTFKRVWWRIMMVVEVLSLLMTFSSSLVAFFVVILAQPFIYHYKISKRVWMVIMIILLIVAIGALIEYFNMNDVFTYIFYNKVEGFFTAVDHTNDSGAFRQYTSRIGFRLFDDFLLFGVGPGMSQYYMHLYEDKMGIINFGETLSAGIIPQNLFAKIFAEQGIIGGWSIFALLVVILTKLWKTRNSFKYSKMFLNGAIVNVACMNTNYIVYSLYLWVFIIMAIGYVNYNNKKARKIKMMRLIFRKRQEELLPSV